MFRRAAAAREAAAKPDRWALASLLAEGEDVIVGRGYRGTRVEDVVAAAGISRGAFYRYFADKRELVRVIAAGRCGR
jgi:AcrR family transcriptional regulator